MHRSDNYRTSRTRALISTAVGTSRFTVCRRHRVRPSGRHGRTTLIKNWRAGMIVLITDFGNAGPYVGQMKAVLCQQAQGRTLIELFADAPRLFPRAAAYLLAAYVDEFPKEPVFLCVVDP